MSYQNREINRFIEQVGSVNGAAEYLGCTPDMLQKMRRGERDFKSKYVRLMYRYPGFRLSFVRLYDLDSKQSSAA